MLRCTLLASAGALALTGAAFAADLAPPPVYLPQARRERAWCSSSRAPGSSRGLAAIPGVIRVIVTPNGNGKYAARQMTRELSDFRAMQDRSEAVLGDRRRTDTGLTVQIVASPRELKPLVPFVKSDHDVSFFGHAFLIVGVKTNSGVKEELFGFYPVGKDISIGKGIIKGPGMLNTNYRCGPTDDCGPANRLKLISQLSESGASVTVAITPEQRQTLYQEINKWDSKSPIGPDDRQVVPSSDKEWQLTNQNCIDFVATVAEKLGYPTPPRSSIQTPMEFVKALKTLVAQEEKTRAADQKAKAEEMRATAAEIARKEAEIKRRQAEARAEAAEEKASKLLEKEKQSIPAGWVACQCPEVHRPFGKTVNGILYHPANITCP